MHIDLFFPTFTLWFSPLLCPAGCTFDEDSESSSCEYRQGQEDDFDWQLIRTSNWPYSSPDLLPGRAGRLIEINRNLSFF